MFAWTCVSYKHTDKADKEDESVLREFLDDTVQSSGNFLHRVIDTW